MNTLSAALSEKNTDHIARFLGSAEAPTEMSAADVADFRNAGTEMVKSLNSLEEVLDEPLRGQFKAVKESINRALATLPETDKTPAALDAGSALRQLLWAFRTAQETIGRISGIAKDQANQVSTLRASMPDEVAKAIEVKVKAGELLKKEDVATQLTEKETSVRALLTAEMKTISDRRQLVVAAKLPVPSDESLKGEEKDFNVTMERAKTRNTKLKDFTVAATEVAHLCWNEVDAGFDRVVGLLTSNKPASRPNAFASGSSVPPVSASSIGVI